MKQILIDIKESILELLKEYGMLIFMITCSVLLGPGIFGLVMFIIGILIFLYLIHYAKTCGSGCFSGLFFIIPISIILTALPFMIMGGFFKMVF